MGRILCFEVDKHSIKIVEALRKKDVVSILNYLTISLNFEDIDNVANTIRNELELNSIKTKKAVFIINSSSVIMRKIRLPFLKNNYEALSMIRNELEQLMSIDLQQYNIIYKTINVNDSSDIYNTDYVVYCLPLSIYNKCVELSNKLKLKLICLDVPNNCLSKIYKYNIKINNEELNIENIYVFINIYLNWCSFCILNNGVNDFSKTIEYNNSNANTIAEETDYYRLNNNSNNSFNDIYLKEICKYIKYYKLLSNKNIINKIFVYGEGSENKNICDYLSKNLNIEVSKIYSISTNEFNSEKVFNEIDHYFNLIIYLLSDESDGCLCNEHYNNKYGFKTHIALIVATSIAIILSGLSILLYSNALLRNKISDLNIYINDKNNVEQNYQIEEIKMDNLRLEALLKKIEIVHGIVSNSDYVLKLLKDIYEAIPVNTKVTSILIDNNNTLLKGVSVSMEDVTIFMRNLKAIKYLESIHVPSIEVNESEHFCYSYTIILQFKDVCNSGY